MSPTQPPRAEGQGVTLLGRAPSGPVDLAEVAVLLDPRDAVAIAKQPLLPRTELRTANGQVRVSQLIPPGHKIALRRSQGERTAYEDHGFARGHAPAITSLHNLSSAGARSRYAPSPSTAPNYVPVASAAPSVVSPEGCSRGTGTPPILAPSMLVGGDASVCDYFGPGGMKRTRIRPVTARHKAAAEALLVVDCFCCRDMAVIVDIPRRGYVS